MVELTAGGFPIRGETAEVQGSDCISVETSKSIVTQKDTSKILKTLQAFCKITSYFFGINWGGGGGWGRGELSKIPQTIKKTLSRNIVTLPV